MSDDKKEVALADQITSGFTLKELEEIKAYREAGLPGIIELTDAKFMSAYDLRLDGRSFREISKTLSLSKATIMHLAEKFNWHERRMEYLEAFEMHMRDQVLEEKIHSQYFIMKAMHVFRKRMGKKMDKYLSTGDETLADTIDMDSMAQYLKMAQAVASLDVKGFTKDPSSGSPAVGINVGDGVNMKKLADGTVEITPRQKSQAEMLADLAKSKREQKSKDQK